MGIKCEFYKKLLLDGLRDQIDMHLEGHFKGENELITAAHNLQQFDFKLTSIERRRSAVLKESSKKRTNRNFINTLSSYVADVVCVIAKRL